MSNEVIERLNVISLNDADPADLAQILMSEAKKVGAEHFKKTIDHLKVSLDMLSRIERGGDVYKSGEREEARGLGESTRLSIQRLQSIHSRSNKVA